VRPEVSSRGGGSKQRVTLNGTERMNELCARLNPAAQRMRRHRQRRRDGMRCLMVELRATEIDVLIRMGLLTAETSNDANAVREALYSHLDQTLD
jgi:hypothetical protein